jgi:hypothetical protein
MAASAVSRARVPAVKQVPAPMRAARAVVAKAATVLVATVSVARVVQGRNPSLPTKRRVWQKL